LGEVRSYCEIKGKTFDPNDKKKYQKVKVDTQLLHLNDITHTGKNRFDFEKVFTDITEGYEVDGKWMMPYTKLTKYAISSNKTVNIQGSSQLDRVIEYEVSDYFSINHSPEDEYGHWFVTDWQEDDWNRYDNFMCFCAQLFLQKGIITAKTINLEQRKLKDYTSQDFLDFMEDIEKSIKKDGIPFEGYYTDGDVRPSSITETDFGDFAFDKKKLYEQFKMEFSDFDKPWFTQNKFTSYLKLYAQYKFGITNVIEKRTHGKGLLWFKSAN